jgi:diadenosine tetraphosphate (Ap4A) HIT family hydrolase
MGIRIWDPENKYPGGVLNKYRYWTLEVSYRQHTLGCFIIFANRPVERISELEPTEFVELGVVMREIERALTANPVFRPDRFNYWQMGNALHHLHFHGIPRYEQPRDFNGQTWGDMTWGSVPIWSKEDIPKSLVEALREVMRQNLT